MAGQTLAELTQAAAAAQEPQLARSLNISPGGVDPLGLRQINFNLMDLVIPGLNNVARHIRPFTVMSWAWRRAAQCADRLETKGAHASEFQDFVARIEVIYVWSQLLRDGSAVLPGSDYLAFLLNTETYTFAGKDWETRRAARKDSTALSAALNYGPALRSLGWVEPSATRGVLKHTEAAVKALDALDRVLGVEVLHDAFSRLGPVTVLRQDVERWGALWALDTPTAEERDVMRQSFLGASATPERRSGSLLIAEAVNHRNGVCDEGRVRGDMCCAPSDFEPSGPLEGTANHWRAVQGRQLFRLALESLLHWTMLRLSVRPATIADLAAAFVEETKDALTNREWLSTVKLGDVDLPTRVVLLEKSLGQDHAPYDLAQAIHAALAVSLAETAGGPVAEQTDRLPLAKARQETVAFATKSPVEFMSHVIGSWVFGQHVYWSVGRGLGDARGGGKTILRLKVVPEENGWTIVPGAGMKPPGPTPDRLETALSLMGEAGMFTVS